MAATFATTRYYPISHTAKLVYEISFRRKGDCTALCSDCTGISGFELNQRWVDLANQGYKLKRMRDKDPRGGARPGSGRPTLNLVTRKIKLHQSVHEKLKTHVERLRQASGMHISFQEYTSQLVLEADWQPIVNEIVTWGEPSSQVTVTDEAYQRLQEMIKKIKPLRQDIYVNRGNVLGAIVLAEIRKSGKKKS